MQWTALPLAIVLVGGCGGDSRRSTELPRSVLVITMDTTRADHLGVYGYSAPTTPNVDALAARGVLFERTYAPMAQTLPSHATLFTGVGPRVHGALANHYSLADGIPTLAERLRERGFRTAAFFGASVLDASSGLARGFDIYEGPDRSRGTPSEPVVERDAQGQTLLDKKGQLVLSERCYLSTMAYQCLAPSDVGARADLETLEQLTRAVHGETWPDRILLLDVDAETRRARSGEASDRIEARDEDFHQRVRQAYLDLAGKDPRVTVVDAGGDVQEVQEDLRAHAKAVLAEVRS